MTGPSGMPIIGRVPQKMDLLREIGLRVGTIFETGWLFGSLARGQKIVNDLDSLVVVADAARV